MTDTEFLRIVDAFIEAKVAYDLAASTYRGVSNRLAHVMREKDRRRIHRGGFVIEAAFGDNPCIKSVDRVTDLGEP